MNRIIKILAVIMMAVTFASCGEETNYMPKPRGYFRIDLPEKSYQSVDTIERYRFECPQYAVVTNDPYSPEQKNWVNVEMPVFKGSIHLTHKDVHGNLSESINIYELHLVKFKQHY